MNEQPNKVKKLPPSVVKDIQLKNHARALAGLSRIQITVRRCGDCGVLFESAGNRKCNECGAKAAANYAGSNII